MSYTRVHEYFTDSAFQLKMNLTMESVACKILRLFIDSQKVNAVSTIKDPDPILHNVLMTFYRHEIQELWLIGKNSHGKNPPPLLAILEWALTELLWLNGLPAAVIVSIAVDQAKQLFPHKASFVNAFLRNICRQAASLQPGETLFDNAPENVRLSLPVPLWHRWKKRFSKSELLSLVQILLQPAQTILRQCNSQAETTALTAVSSPEWAPATKLWTTNKLDGYKIPGDFYIQDSATLLAPALLAVKPGESVADLCSAPGGKSRILAENLQGHGTLFCLEKDAGKLPRIQENLTGFNNVTIQCGDASSITLPPASFDAILLDVPCSNSGVIRRRPDVRREFTEQRLAAHAELQYRILSHAATLLKPGGRLVYSTCSIEPEENQQLVRRFCKDFPAFTIAAEKELLPSSDHDGAFAALLCLK